MIESKHGLHFSRFIDLRKENIMKNLIMINGTMGVGKTATGKELQKMLPDTVFLDGDWCWDMRPFTVNEETKGMVMDNIIFLLNNFLRCSVYENIIFCWVMHEQSIIDEIIFNLETEDCKIHVFSLVCSEEALISRIRKDISCALRKEDVIERALKRLCMYERLNTVKIDVSEISAEMAAKTIKTLI